MGEGFENGSTLNSNGDEITLNEQKKLWTRIIKDKIRILLYQLAAVRIAIAVGQDADPGVLQKFVDNLELKSPQANISNALVKYTKWVSIAVLETVSPPASKTKGRNNRFRMLNSLGFPRVLSIQKMCGDWK